MTNIRFDVACNSNCPKQVIMDFLSFLGYWTHPPKHRCSVTELGKQLIMCFIAFLLHHLVLAIVLFLVYLAEPISRASRSTPVP